MKYDEHGFLTESWASENVQGWTDMNECCKQATLLFPETPPDCAVVTGPPNTQPIIPGSVYPAIPAVLGGTLPHPPLLYDPVAGIVTGALVTTVVVAEEEDNDPTAINEPSFALVMAIGIVALVVARVL